MKYAFFTFLVSFFQIIASANIQTPKFVHYTNKDGLSSSYVKGIQQDKYGFIWVATRENITRFENNRFVKFPAFDVLDNEIELEPQSISCINDSLILVESMQNFYYYFDYNTECFKPYTPLYNSIKKDCVTGINSSTALFLQSNNLKSLNLKEGSISFSNLFSKILNKSITEQILKITSNKNIIIAYTTSDRILVYNKKTKVYSQFKVNITIPNEIVFIKTDINNNIWISNYATGLIKINYPSGKQTKFTTETTPELPHNMVHCIAIDRKNRAWIGTENGLCIWDEYSGEFKCFKYDITIPEGLNTNPIYNAFADIDGNIWLGTYFGGINLWCDKPTKFTHWKTGTGIHHLGGKVVSCFLEDRFNNIWIGTEDMGINKLNPNTGVIDKVTASINKNYLSYENVHDILMVHNNLWIATYSGGINILNTKNDNIRCIQVANEPNLGSDFVYSFTQKDSLIYIGTDVGVSLYNTQTKKFSRLDNKLLQNQVCVSFAWKEDILWMCTYEAIYSFNSKTKQVKKHKKLTTGFIFAQIFTDSKNRLWLATNNKGLIRYDDNTESITYFNKSNGFPANRIFAIEEANDQTIWLSTNLGLINFNPKDNSFTNYDSNSGIPFNQFNFRASFKDSKGIIYFGSNEGMISINPENYTLKAPAPVQFTELLLFNKHITPEEDSPILKSITLSPKIKLKHHQNSITINYTSLDYTNTGSISYAYKLEGFDNNYNYVGNKTSATYTNLDPGKYTFIVKSSNDAWVNESDVNKIQLKITPPFWLTPYAFASYAIIFISTFLLLNSIIIRMQESKSQIALERQKRLHNDQINNFKLEFFTNISHEIKTPLTLILGPLSKLIDNQKLDTTVKNQLNRIYLNVNRLNSLLGELLEFRKIDKASTNFRVSKSTDFLYIKNIEDAYRCISEHHKINFFTSYNNASEEVWLNKAIIEKIIFNLLSNSFKYCKEGDTVNLSVEINTINNAKSLTVIVNDNGPGISEEELNNVKKRFFQAESAKKMNKGAGIGLSYVNNLVKLHHGTIDIKSELYKGTSVSIVLPCDKGSYSDAELSETYHSENTMEDIQMNQDLNNNATNLSDTDLENDNMPSLLIVEDNLELLAFLNDILVEYNITVASNGKEALSVIKENNNAYDLIVSDIMMPEMDGLQLTNILKSSIATSHIPIILLTAKSGSESQYEGLKQGADAYLEKPFLPEILKQNIKNIVRTRQNIIKNFSQNTNITPSDLTSSQRDKEFMEDLTKIIKDNIDNTSMDVQFIIDKLHVSRSLLHTKLKSLANCSTTEYIRIIRLRSAIEIINNDKCSFSEAAYKSGFTSLTYFSRAFKNQYGKSPSEFFNRS